MGVNTKYKDSVFVSLFSDPDILRELYCALNGINLPPDAQVNINTLRNILFMDKVNDISFEIEGKLVVLIEHQSTINHNMALRLLMYIARVYEKIIEDKNVYAKDRIYIPRPEFFVLYNGVYPYPDEETLKLSAAYEDASSLGVPLQDSPSLELVVKVININEGRNAGIAKKCETLAQYSAFVGKVRRFEKEGLSREEAMKKAIIYCRSHDILKEFLEQNSSEVMNMLLTTEWNWDDALAVRYDEGIAKGISQGIEQGTLEVARKMRAADRSLEEIKEFTGLDLETIENI